jgi:vacuolar protein sorting-associated protein IST1
VEKGDELHTNLFVLPLQLVWKLSGNTTSMKLKKKVTKDIAAENNVLADFSELPEETEDISVDFSELQEVTDDGNSNAQELFREMPCQDDMDESSELEDGNPSSHRTNDSSLESDENVQVITNSDGSDDEITGRRSRKWWRLGCT